jgi:hypothetical protein
MVEERLIRNILSNKKTKKISYNIHEENLKMIDELAKIVGMTRTQILDALIVSGTKAQVNYMIGVWAVLKRDKKYKDKKKRVNELLKKMIEFKSKWKIEEILS